MSVKAFAAAPVLAPLAANAGEATRIAQGDADAVNRQSTVVKRGVKHDVRQIVCMVAGGNSHRCPRAICRSPGSGIALTRHAGRLGANHDSPRMMKRGTVLLDLIVELVLPAAALAGAVPAIMGEL